MKIWLPILILAAVMLTWPKFAFWFVWICLGLIFLFICYGFVAWFWNEGAPNKLDRK